MRFRQKYPAKYRATGRISLASSFLASIFVGRLAPIDVSDVCGTNLWDMQSRNWRHECLALVVGSDDICEIEGKLGRRVSEGYESLGRVSRYFVSKYGFPSYCRVVPSTGEVSAIALSFAMRPFTAVIGLDDPTTVLMRTSVYETDASSYVIHHPTDSTEYLYMRRFENGENVREQFRAKLETSKTVNKADAWDTLMDREIFRERIKAESAQHRPYQTPKTVNKAASWDAFNDIALSSSSFSEPHLDDTKFRIGVYFSNPEFHPGVSPELCASISIAATISLSCLPRMIGGYPTTTCVPW